MFGTPELTCQRFGGELLEVKTEHLRHLALNLKKKNHGNDSYWL